MGQREKKTTFFFSQRKKRAARRRDETKKESAAAFLLSLFVFLIFLSTRHAHSHIMETLARLAGFGTLNERRRVKANHRHLKAKNKKPTILSLAKRKKNVDDDTSPFFFFFSILSYRIQTRKQVLLPQLRHLSASITMTGEFRD